MGACSTPEALSSTQKMLITCSPKASSSPCHITYHVMITNAESALLMCLLRT